MKQRALHQPTQDVEEEPDVVFVPVDDEVVEDCPAVVVLDAQVQQVSLNSSFTGQQLPDGVPAVLHGAPQQGAVALPVAGVDHSCRDNSQYTDMHLALILSTYVEGLEKV